MAYWFMTANILDVVAESLRITALKFDEIQVIR